MKRFAAFGLFILMTAFATQTVSAGGIGIGNHNGGGVHDDNPWYKSGAPSDTDNDSCYKKKPNPDDDDRGPSEEDEGVMVWDRPVFFWHVNNMQSKGF